jgi:hypothetical protein
VLNRRALEAEAAACRKEAARFKAQRDKSQAELSAARGKAGVTADALLTLEETVLIEQLRMLQFERLADAYENVAAGRRAFVSMPGPELTRAKGAA